MEKTGENEAVDWVVAQTGFEDVASCEGFGEGFEVNPSQEAAGYQML